MLISDFRPFKAGERDGDFLVHTTKEIGPDGYMLCVKIHERVETEFRIATSFVISAACAEDLIESLEEILQELNEETEAEDDGL